MDQSLVYSLRRNAATIMEIGFFLKLIITSQLCLSDPLSTQSLWVCVSPILLRLSSAFFTCIDAPGPWTTGLQPCQSFYARYRLSLKSNLHYFFLQRLYFSTFSYFRPIFFVFRNLHYIRGITPQRVASSGSISAITPQRVASSGSISVITPQRVASSGSISAT